VCVCLCVCVCECAFVCACVCVCVCVFVCVPAYVYVYVCECVRAHTHTHTYTHTHISRAMCCDAHRRVEILNSQRATEFRTWKDLKPFFQESFTVEPWAAIDIGRHKRVLWAGRNVFFGAGRNVFFASVLIKRQLDCHLHLYFSNYTKAPEFLSSSHKSARTSWPLRKMTETCPLRQFSTNSSLAIMCRKFRPSSCLRIFINALGDSGDENSHKSAGLSFYEVNLVSGWLLRIFISSQPRATLHLCR